MPEGVSVASVVAAAAVIGDEVEEEEEEDKVAVAACAIKVPLSALGAGADQDSVVGSLQLTWKFVTVQQAH